MTKKLIGRSLTINVFCPKFAFYKNLIGKKLRPKSSIYLRPLTLLLAIVAFGGCATIQKANAYKDIVKSAVTPTSMINYDWRKILKGPPEQTSPNQSSELEIVRELQKSATIERIEQARRDNSIDSFYIYGAIIGPNFTIANNPELAALWTYAGRQMAANSNNAKAMFPRPRPFLESNDIKICIDKAPDGSSYPSGHASWGWLSAQILARIYPEKTSEILGRGIDYGQSRIICGVHYPSDVADGRLVGASILLSLEGDEEFQKLMTAAIKAKK